MPTPDELAILYGPATAAPPGWVSDFRRPCPILVQLWATLGITTFFTTTAIAIRVFARLRVHRAFASEDYTSVLAYVTCMAYQGIFIYALTLGSGKHLWDLRVIDLEPILMTLFAGRIIYGFPLALSKTSILLQYLSIFNPVIPRLGKSPHGYMFWSCWITIIITNSLYIALLFASIFSTTPIAKNWTPWMTTGTVNMDGYTADLVTGAVNSVIDLVIIALPQHSLWRMRRQSKESSSSSTDTARNTWNATFVFGLSLLALASSVRRTKASYDSMQSGDKTYQVASEALWTGVELATTIICGCLPCVAVFAAYLRAGTGVARRQQHGQQLSQELQDFELQENERRELVGGMAGHRGSGAQWSLDSAGEKEGRQFGHS